MVGEERLGLGLTAPGERPGCTHLIQVEPIVRVGRHGEKLVHDQHNLLLDICRGIELGLEPKQLRGADVAVACRV